VPPNLGWISLKARPNSLVFISRAIDRAFRISITLSVCSLRHVIVVVTGISCVIKKLVATADIKAIMI
jgi:hypothetical protein